MMHESMLKYDGSCDDKEKAKKAVEKIFKAGYQLEAEAFALIQSSSSAADPEEVVQKILETLEAASQASVFIDRETVEKAIPLIPQQAEMEPSLKIETGKGLFRPYAKDIEADIEVVKNPSAHVTSGEDLESFSRYFRDRFERLKRILSQRLDVKGCIDIESFLRERTGVRVKVVGMVSEKITSGKKVILRIEDLENMATVLVQPTKLGLTDKARMILQDQIVCVVGVKAAEGLIVAEDILLPDVPNHKPNISEEDINAVLTSDLHIGSNLFERALFERFLEWLRGRRGSEKEKEIIGRIKYIIVAGDMVDGIGLYPQQENELEIKDIYKQYEATAKYFECIPDYVQVILIPGNHDAVRKAMPQPAIPKEFAESLHRLPNTVFLGNPAQVKLHGVQILIHHGRSFEDVLASLPQANHQNITVTMVQLLKARHIAPIYGQRTPLAPEPRDWMVVDSVPDVYHAGHIHVFGYTSYRGVKVVNSGCWQAQTSYQKKLGITPTYGITPTLNLHTANVMPINFTEIP